MSADKQGMNEDDSDSDNDKNKDWKNQQKGNQK